MKNIFILSIVIFFVNNMLAQKDSLIIIKLKLSRDTIVGGVQGVSLMISYKLCYDTLFHGSKMPSTAYADVGIYNNGKQVKAVSSTNSYMLNKKEAGCRFSTNASYVSVRKIHIPYYAMDLSEGVYDIELRISAWQNDTATFADKTYRVKVYGDSLIKAKVKIPSKEYFRVLVSGVRVMDTDFGGKQWDYNLISGAPPDIVWKVIASESEWADYFYVSPMMENSYSAAWLDDSGVLCVSSGDKFWVKVYDADPLNDDIMAYKQVTVDELIELSKMEKPMELGRLTYFRVNCYRADEK